MSLTNAKAEHKALLQRTATPWGLFRVFDRMHNYTLDVCAEEWSAKCPRYFTKERDGLKQDWAGEVCWCNPPYETIEPWVKKANEHGRLLKNATVSLLVPARTDREWFLESLGWAEILFLKGRFTFLPPPDWKGKWSTGGFPLMLMTFGPKVKPDVRAFDAKRAMDLDKLEAGQSLSWPQVNRPAYPEEQGLIPTKSLAQWQREKLRPV